MAKISPLAYIDPEAVIGENCEIGPFCYIDKNVVIGDNNTLMNSVTLLSGTRLGNENTLFPGAVIGAIPQDLKFKGEESTVEIGNGNRIRENVTIHRGTASKGKTTVGNNNLIMENAHIAHDCVFGKVIVDDNAIISAVVLVHQFCHIAGYTMVQGGCRTSQDIPPFVIAAREPIAYAGINIVGLRRRRFAPETINNIHDAYRMIYNSNLTVKEAVEQIMYSIPMTEEIQYIVDFVTNSQRGIIR